MRRCGLFFTFFAFIILIPWSSRVHAQKEGSAQKVSSAECLACHNNPDITKEVDGKQISVYVNEDTFNASAHRTLSCSDCHSDVKGYPHEPSPQKVFCGNCHIELAKEYAGSIHSEARANGGLNAASCADCHGAHDIFAKDDIRSSVNHLKVADTCSKCHADQRITQQHALPSPDFIKKYRESVHGRGVLVSGLTVSAVCSDCHGAHNIRPRIDSSSTIFRANIPRTCGKCHLGILNDFEKSSHGALWKNADNRGPVCSTCHKSHEIKSPLTVGFQLQIPAECGRCHENRTPSYRDTFHGQATSLGFAVAAKCSDCHTPHLNLPRNDPASSVAPGNLAQTCGKCHAAASAKFLSYDPHPDPSDKNKSLVLYSTHVFMKWLLISVFGFFGVHTVLWFQRSLVAFLRKEVPREREDGKYVLRFILPHRITHIVMIVSFLGLAATGLPLRYHFTGWGRALGAILGGVEVSRYFHRVWAIVTIGYAVYHLGYLLRASVIRREFSLFRGSNSLVPRKKDIVDLFSNVRWFVYSGARPKLDRWAYWEKFDYFAVFWGIPVIGLSGLMLWLPEVFTKLLPGSLLNVAMIVHGEEALLAVGFIFAFHFFHNHLRPESFPLDIVMFTGKMPLERFKRERPEEYERLSREGKLDEVIVERPSQTARTVSTWFGIGALVIGIILIAAIFATYLLRS